MQTHLYMQEMVFFERVGHTDATTVRHCRGPGPPVSASLKLKAFEPRFLLKSVEGGERLARYSSLDFGAGPSLELFPDRLLINGAPAPRPTTVTGWSTVLRHAMN